MNRIIFILIACITGFTLNCHALNFKNLSTSDGLSNRRVFMSAKDNDGYMWLATRAGIDCYNGESFHTYTLYDPDTNTELNPKGIICDSKNNLIAYTETHLFYYDINHDEFRLIHKLKRDTEDNKEIIINTISISDSEQIWIGTTSGLFKSKFDKEPEKIGQLDNKSIYSICIESEDIIWLGTGSGLCYLTVNELTDTLSSPQSIRILDGKRIQSLYRDELTHDLWIGTFHNGLYRFNSEKNKLDSKYSSEHTNPVRSISLIGEDKIWIGNDGGGIYEFDRFDGQLLEQLSQQKNGRYHINTNNIYHINDCGSTVLICTYTHGVLIHQKAQFKTTEYRHKEFTNQSLADNHINTIMEDRAGRIWFGTNHGISRLDPASGAWTHFMQDRTESNKIFLTLIQDHNDNVWAGGYSCDIFLIDPNDNVHRIDLPLPENKKERFRYVYTMHEDESGMIWMGSLFNPMICYNPQTNELSRHQIRGITQIIPWQKDKLIATTNNGAIVFDKTSGKYQALKARQAISALSSNIRWISIDPQNNDLLWIATEDSGIISLNMSDGSSTLLNTSTGLSSNNVCALSFDKKGRLWASTENGLNCINTVTGNTDAFYTTDGILSNMLNLRAMELLKNGDLMIGSPDGAFRFNPDEYSHKPLSKTNLRFEEFALFNVPSKPGEESSPLTTTIDKTDEIILDHDQHSFSFRFLNISHFDSFKNQYSWYLEGFDKDWCRPTEAHQAIYTNIPSGNYKFHVKVSKRGQDNEYQERTISIRIRQPWWNTIWAWIAYLLLFAFIVYEITEFYKKQLEARDSDQKIRFFINLAHDIRTPLTLVKAPLNEIADEPLSDNGRAALELAQRNTEKLMNMVTQLLDFQKIEREVMSLQVEETAINSFIGTTISDFGPLAKERGITLHPILCETENTCYIDRKKVTIIIENLISNSLKYTCQGGNIWIKANVDKGVLTLQITDDGIGIPQKDQTKLFNRFYRAENAINSNETGSGIGLLLIKKMTLLHKGDISFSSKEKCGTTFTIKLPVLKENYSKTELVRKEYAHRQHTDDMVPEDKSRLSLMIVEDNEELRGYLSHYFSQDYTVIESPDGADALKTIRKCNPDFIISDIMMPNMSGTELCKALKSNIETCHIPVILLTSLTDREDIINGLNAGADDYITKPFDMPVLRSKIKTIINNRKLFQKKYLDKSAFTDDSVCPNEFDRKFMKQVVDYIEDKMSCEDFSIDNLANEMAMSRSVFFKKIKSLTGQNPQDFIRDFKMKRAVTLLAEKRYSIGEIAYLTGYPNAKYFSTAFKKYYGKTPSNYFQQQEQEEI